MLSITIKELLGIKGKTILWERPLFFFAALAAGNLVWLLLAPTIRTTDGGAPTFRMFEFPPPSIWVVFLLEGLLLAGLALAAFRWIPSVVTAVCVAAVLQSLGARAIWVWSGQFGPSAPFWDFGQLIQGVTWAGIFLGSIALALRWVKPIWLALLTGAIVSTALNRLIIVANFSGQEGWGRSLQTQLLFAPFALLEMALIAGVLWAGLWLGIDKPSAHSEAKPCMRRGFYVGTLVVTWGLTIIISIAVTAFSAAGTWKASDVPWTFALLGFAGLVMAYGIVVMAVLIYKMWAAIQDGHARTSPSKAIGLLFIPFYNIYWAFQVFPGFAKDFNSYATRHSLKARQLPPGLFVAYTILAIASAIPVLGVLAALADFFVMFAMVSRICDAVNGIPQSMPAAPVTLAA